MTENIGEELDCKSVECEESHLSVCLLICLCLGTSCVCVELNGCFGLFFMKEGCVGTLNLVMQLTLYPLTHSKQNGQMAGPQEGLGALDLLSDRGKVFG